MNNLDKLSQELRATKKRTGVRLGTAVDKGKFQIQVIGCRDDGVADVTPLTEFLPLSEAIEFVENFAR